MAEELASGSVALRAMLRIGIILMATSMAGCAGKGDPAPAAPIEKITYVAIPTPFSVPLFVAQEKGYFREEGLEATPLSDPSGPLAIADLCLGKVDIAESGDMAIAQAVLAGRPLEIIGTISESSRAMRIIARKDRGIRTPEDLRGKTIGLALGTTAEFYLHVCLVNALVGTEDVRLVDLPIDKVAPALLQGEVDAVSASPPYTLTLQEQLGSNATALEDPGLCSVAVSLVATRDFNRRHPERVQRFLRAVRRACRDVEEHPGEARALCARRVGLPEALLAKDWEDYTFDLVLDQGLILNLEDQARWMVETRSAGASVPDFLDFIYTTGLKQVDPEAMRIAGK